MNTKTPLIRPHGAAAAVLGLVLAACACGTAQAGTPHQAKPRGAHAQPQKSRPGGDYTRHTEVQRTDNGHTRTDTWTGENGKSATRQAEVVNDRAAQTRTRNVEWTGPAGQQATRTDVTQRTDDGYTRNTTAVGPKGATTTRDVVATHDPASGTWTKDVKVDHTPAPAPANGG
jgi:hypothetical protein